jgi:hypothetical protein
VFDVDGVGGRNGRCCCLSVEIKDQQTNEGTMFVVNNFLKEIFYCSRDALNKLQPRKLHI